MRDRTEFLLCTVLLATSTPMVAQGAEAPETTARRSERPIVDVFRAGEDGYASFRIPAIVRADDGALLAFAEGRVNSRSDSGDIDIVMRSSTDGGETWGKLQVVADHGEGCVGNPTPVVERETGHVVLLVTLQPPECHERDIRAGTRGERYPAVLRSEDGGRTWSEPASLRDTCDRDDWRWYATGPCHAIQLRHGDHAGRLVAPANHSTDGGAGNAFLSGHALYSDDGGRTWQIGAVDEHEVASNALNPNESTVAEWSDGRLIFNSRNHGSEAGPSRLVAYSDDGGESFTAPYRPEAQLTAPVCQAALLTVAVPARARAADGGGDAGATLLIYCGPADAKQREQLRLRVSADGGRSWSDGPLLYGGSAAYSDVVELPGARLGCYFEADGYARIVFTTIDLAEVVPGR